MGCAGDTASRRLRGEQMTPNVIQIQRNLTSVFATTLLALSDHVKPKVSLPSVAQFSGGLGEILRAGSVIADTQ